MLKFNANLSWLFTEIDFMNRFERAAKAGFKGVEFRSPYEWNADAILEKLNRYGLELVLYNLPAGNWAVGERGIACRPDRMGEFQHGVGLAIQYAKILKCHRVNCLAGMSPKGVLPEKARQTFIDNLKFAVTALEKECISLLIEPLNGTDMPEAYLTHTNQGLEIIREVNHLNIRLQYDIYHMQIMEGNLTQTIKNSLSTIGHIQVADNPGRHEPGTGEINFDNLFRFLEEADYAGWVGCEYKPARTTESSLDWFKNYIQKAGL